jgi:hypothetical protein
MLCGSFAFALMGTLAHALGRHCDWQVIALALDVLVWERSFDSTTLLGMGLVVAPTAWVMVYRA